MPLPEMVALWLKDDNVVRIGEEDYEPVMAGGETLDPVDAIHYLSTKYERFLLFDLDGIEQGKPQLELFQDCGEIAEIWTDAGSIDSADAADIAVSGATRVVCGTKSLRGWKELEEVTDMMENVVFSLDVSEDIVAPFLEKKDFDSIIDEVTTLPLAGGILMDIKGRWTTPRNLEELADSFREFYYYSPSPYKLEERDTVGKIIDLDEALKNMGGEPPWSQEMN